jgi:hypothetical protein
LLQLGEDDIKVLKAIYRIGKATPEELASKLGEPYTADNLSAYLQYLEKEKFLEKTSDFPNAYRLTGFALMAIDAIPKEAWRVLTSLPPDKQFKFFTGSSPNQNTGIIASNLANFRDKIRTIDIRALEFHSSRGDFENWVRDVFGDDDLSARLRVLRELNFKGEKLRNELFSIVSKRCEELTCRKY